MVKLREPTGIRVNGVGVFIRDQNAAVGKLHAKYMRVPGLGSITLPDEAAPQNDAIGLDGVVGATGFSGVGSITVPVPHLGQHPTHRFLGSRKRDKAPFLVSVRRPASRLFSVGDGIAAGGAAVAAEGLSVVSVPDTHRSAVKNKLREGMLIAIADIDPDPGAFVDSGAAAPAAADDVQFQTVVDLEADGSEFRVAPGFGAVNSAGFDLWVRQPGKEWLDVECTAGQMGDGDWQAAAILAGNLVLIPTFQLPPDTVVVTLESDVAGII